MKRRVFVFLLIALLGLLIVPAINIFKAPRRDAIEWRKKSFLYNMDFASRLMAKFLYPLGISTDPLQVIVGRDGWLYLGDAYELTRTTDRRAASDADMALGKQIGHSTEAWDAYLSTKGVKLFRIMIGPNKGTIYSEYLPSWAKPASPNATDALISGTRATKYIDLRASLLKAKEVQISDLYYKTDTHWNYLGAAIAFQAFAQQASPLAPELQWPSQSTYEPTRVDYRPGGDLANFLRLTASLSDQEPIVNAASLPIETTQTDFDTQKILHQGGNPAVSSPQNPLLVRSIGALNKKRVLWLRDSFGNAMSPLMAATFSDVLQLHWGEAIRPGGRFLQLIEEWKPDYVFFTVVERGARNPWFTAYPPPAIIPNSSAYKKSRSTSFFEFNHLSKLGTENEFQITGDDPFFDIALSSTATPSEARYLSIDITCNDKSTSVPLQLFWLESGRPYFNEDHSAKLMFLTGNNIIDLHTIKGFQSSEKLSRIRIDIDAKNSCSHFKLSAPTFGVNATKSIHGI